MTARAPRGLKLPVRWNSSSLRTTRISLPTACRMPRSSHSRTGVVITRSPSRSRVARIASIVGASALVMAPRIGTRGGPPSPTAVRSLFPSRIAIPVRSGRSVP